MEVRLITTRRSAPAMSTPPLKALRTTASTPNRKRATANDPIVRTKRIFLRNKLARINPKNFIAHLRWQPAAVGQLPPARLFPGEESHLHARPRPDHALPSARFCDTPSPGAG